MDQIKTMPHELLLGVAAMVAMQLWKGELALSIAAYVGAVALVKTLAFIRKGATA